MPLAKRLQRKELIRAIAIGAGALIFLAACHSDPVEVLPGPCGVGPPAVAPFTAVTFSGGQLAQCLNLSANGAAYLVVGQFASVGDPTVGINWQLGTGSLVLDWTCPVCCFYSCF